MFVSVGLIVGLALLQEPKISLEIRGARVINIAKVLEKQFGEPIFVAPNLREDPLIIRVKDVTPSELREKIATVLNANWFHDNSGWQLMQTPIQQREEKKYSETARRENLLLAMEKSRKKIASQEEFNEGAAKKMVKELEALSKVKLSTGDDYDPTFWRKQNQLDARGPYARFSTRLLPRIGVDLLMSATEDEPRKVFSNNPNGMQYPLNIKLDDLVDKLAEEQQVWSDVAKGRTFEGPMAPGGGRYSLGETARNTTPLLGRPKTVIVSLSYQDQYLQAELKMFDANGKKMLETNLETFSYEEEDYVALPPEPGKKPFKLSPEAEEYTKLMTTNRNLTQGKPMSPSLEAKLLEPETYDPVGLAACEVMFDAAEDRNVVAYFTDSFGMFQRINLKTKYLDRAFKIKLTDKWLTWAPINPYASRKQLLNRPLLGKLVRFAKDKDSLTIEEESDFAFSLPWRENRRYEYMNPVNLMRKVKLPTYNDDKGLRVFASMPKDIRDLAGKENGFTYSRLPQATKTELFRCLFYGNSWESRPDMDYESLNRSGQDAGREMQRIQDLIYNGLWSEITNVLPNGIPNDANMKVKDETEDSIFIDADSSAENYSNGRIMGANELGSHMFQSKNPERYPWQVDRYNRIDLNRIRLVKHRTVNIEFRFAKGVIKRWYLSEAHLKDSSIYTMDTLPAEVKKQVAEGYKQAEEQDKHYGNYNRGNVGGGDPPPPL